jgi:hypothetical protein
MSFAMARNLIERRLAGWLALLGYDARVAEGLKRNGGPSFNAEQIEQAALAFNLDPTSPADLQLLLAVPADICFPKPRPSVCVRGLPAT